MIVCQDLRCSVSESCFDDVNQRWMYSHAREDVDEPAMGDTVTGFFKGKQAGDPILGGSHPAGDF